MNRSIYLSIHISTDPLYSGAPAASASRSRFCVPARLRCACSFTLSTESTANSLYILINK